MARSNSSSCRGGWCEVPFDERAARTGLEVLLKADRFRFGWKLGATARQSCIGSRAKAGWLFGTSSATDPSR